MNRAVVFLFLLFVAASMYAGALPGFRVQLLGATSGFADSIAIDFHNIIYYTTTAGDVFRFSNGTSQRVAHVNTVATGNSGLLGLALRDDNTAIIHYTTIGQTADVISSIDLTSGAETVIHTFLADIESPGGPSSP